MTRGARPSPARSDGPDVVVRIYKVAAEGDGLGRLEDGRVVFVAGGLPGELVRCRITRQSRDYARAAVVDVIEPHRQRVDPPCPYVAQGCGGCDLQHASLALQWDIKCAIVVESLTRLGKIVAPVVRPFGTGPAAADGSLADRAKRLTVRVVGDASGRPGFRRRSSHDVVAIDHCLAADDGVNLHLVDLRLDPGYEAILRGETTSVMHVNIEGVRFSLSSGSFFQSSVAAAEDLVRAVREALGDPAEWVAGPVVDAYGGVGLFSATVVPPDRESIMIEVSGSACGDARVNLGDRRARIVEGPLETWAPESAAAVIADPPRDGLRTAGASVLAATGAPIIVLVSCDPASLGRDARLLGEAGYRFHSARVLGAFPHTHHVETVSRFEKIA
ncbi:MAG: class I SAM-dependent RNA methyltransferase [Ilumatobacteraceae bacterium]